MAVIGCTSLVKAVLLKLLVEGQGILNPVHKQHPSQVIHLVENAAASSSLAWSFLGRPFSSL
jgi:hypothetical protein